VTKDILRVFRDTC